MKISVLVPHEDDELNICGSLLADWAERGFEVQIGFITNGDFKDLAGCRYKESQSVAAMLAVSKIIYFGYPDSGTDGLLGPTIYDDGADGFVSNNGYSETYHPAGSNFEQEFALENTGCHQKYSRGAILADLESYISRERPDVIISTGWDAHPDHRGASVLISEALLNVVREIGIGNYCPAYLEGFAYLGTWQGPDDYFANKAVGTLERFFSGTGSCFPFEWEQRVCIDICSSDYRLLFWKSRLFKLYSRYTSQTGIAHFFRCVNTDKCFWTRDLRNVALYANCFASSGDANSINDFKLLDFHFARTGELKHGNSALRHWEPDKDDLYPKVVIESQNPFVCKKVVIHQGYGLERMACTISFNKTSKRILIDKCITEVLFEGQEFTNKVAFSFDRIDRSPIVVREIEIFESEDFASLIQPLFSSIKATPERQMPRIRRFCLKLIRRVYIFAEAQKKRRLLRHNKGCRC